MCMFNPNQEFWFSMKPYCIYIYIYSRNNKIFQVPLIRDCIKHIEGHMFENLLLLQSHIGLEIQVWGPLKLLWFIQFMILITFTTYDYSIYYSISAFNTNVHITGPYWAPIGDLSIQADRPTGSPTWAPSAAQRQRQAQELGKTRVAPSSAGRRGGASIVRMDGFMGKNYGKTPSSMGQSWWFPVDFPLNQPVEEWFFELLAYMLGARSQWCATK